MLMNQHTYYDSIILAINYHKLFLKYHYISQNSHNNHLYLLVYGAHNSADDMIPL